MSTLKKDFLPIIVNLVIIAAETAFMLGSFVGICRILGRNYDRFAEDPFALLGMGVLVSFADISRWQFQLDLKEKIKFDRERKRCAKQNREDSSWYKW